MPNRITVRPHWIMRLFGACDATFSPDPDGVLVERRYGGSFLAGSQSLVGGYGAQHGLYFSSLRIHTDRGGRRLRGLRAGDAEEVSSWLRRHLYELLSEEVGREADILRSALRHGSLRSSRWSAIRSRACKAVELFHRVPEEGVIEEERRGAFALLGKIAAMGEEDAEVFRERYLTRCKEAYADLFDRIESNPLTESQREACIIDEDNNLMLAGAGTDKTSTMVGRAAFLLESGQAGGGEILMLAYGSKAAAEMQERLEERLDVVGMTATTFHAIGRRIISDVEGGATLRQPPRRGRQGSCHPGRQLVPAASRGAGLSPSRAPVFRAISASGEEPLRILHRGGVSRISRRQRGSNPEGGAVRSLEECLIADYLFRMGVEYDYRGDYATDTRSPDFRAYRPAFYLPEFGVYIEHLGFDRDGDAAPWIDGEAYRRGVEWRRRLHEEQGTHLIETFGYEQVEGNLLELLDGKLRAAGVLFDPLPEEAVLETLEEFGALGGFSRLLIELLSCYKAGWFEPEQLMGRLREAGNPDQVRSALEVLRPILAFYQADLAERGEIDFHDMIDRALDHVLSGRFRSPWRYLLVDEFQDISDPRARLVKALRDGVAGASLFCVGDDWQAIYRFAGSDISFTTGFAGYFGATVTTTLDKTFRFNNSICDIASRFVMKNRFQVEKRLTTQTKVENPAVSLLWRESAGECGALLRALE